MPKNYSESDVNKRYCGVSNRGIGEGYSDATQKLKIESQRMEERLRMLRQVMAVEKTQREYVMKVLVIPRVTYIWLSR